MKGFQYRWEEEEIERNGWEGRGVGGTKGGTKGGTEAKREEEEYEEVRGERGRKRKLLRARS